MTLSVSQRLAPRRNREVGRVTQTGMRRPVQTAWTFQTLEACHTLLLENPPHSQKDLINKRKRSGGEASRTSHGQMMRTDNVRRFDLLEEASPLAEHPLSNAE